MKADPDPLHCNKRNKRLPGDGLGDCHNDNVDDKADEQVDPELGLVPQVQTGQGQEEPRDSMAGDLQWIKSVFRIRIRLDLALLIHPLLYPLIFLLRCTCR
jgi:hypothetical protein